MLRFNSNLLVPMAPFLLAIMSSLTLVPMVFAKAVSGFFCSFATSLHRVSKAFVQASRAIFWILQRRISAVGVADRYVHGLISCMSW